MKHWQLRFWVGIVATVLIVQPFMFGQEVSYEAIATTVEAGAIAVALSEPRAQLSEGQNATRENISLLANVKTICVLPYDGWKAKEIIEALPSLDGVRNGLLSDKGLRQQRNEANEELSKQGFQPVDCSLAGSSPDAELLFTKVRARQYIGSDLPSYSWQLYANNQHQIMVHGESELLGLGRPAYGWLPLSISSMAEQIRSVVDAARAVTPGTGVSFVTRLSDVKKFCITAPEDIKSQALEISKSLNLDSIDCREAPNSSFDTYLLIGQFLGSWQIELIPRGGSEDLYKAEAKNLQIGTKDLSKALKKSASR